MPKRKKRVDHYSPARRLQEVVALINSSGGATVYDIAERLKVSVRTAIRYLRALEKAGEPLYEEMDGRRKVWRLQAGARQNTITLTAAQMIALFLSGRVLDFLDGTGFKEDLDEVFARLAATLRRKDFVAVKNLDRKIYDVNESPHIYEGRVEDMNDIVTALISEHRLRVRHDSVDGGRKPFVVEPLTLLIYKKGVYLVANSTPHGAIRYFVLDGFRSVDWLKGDRFEYPANYRPEHLADGAFGLFSGPRELIRIFFDKKVRRFVQRRRWHPSQKIRDVPGGIELTMEVAGTTELIPWVLGFGDTATVIDPPSLRAQIAAELRRAAARY
jgi:proteasome accessory factor B